MLTCYLVSDCGHSICGSCQKRQVDQSATRCPVCNVNLVCYIPNIALRNAARELACTCKHCNRQITAEAVESHKNECGEIPLQCNTCPEKFPRNQLGFHECPNEITDCTCGARVKRMEMQKHKTQHCPCLPVFCPLACGLELARKDISLHMAKCPKRVVQCAVPGCQVMIRLSEVELHERQSTTKHLDLFETDRQKKAWSLYEGKISTEIECKDAVLLTWRVPRDWKWPIASPPMDAFRRKWRLVLTGGKLWLQHFRGVDAIRIVFAFFIENTTGAVKKVFVSRSNIKLKERRGHGFTLPTVFSEGTELRVNCRVLELAANLKDKF